MSAYEIIDHHLDVVVVGAGGAGLRATLGMATSGLRQPVSLKSFQLARTRLRRKAASAQPLITWVKAITGNSICMTRSRGLTG